MCVPKRVPSRGSLRACLAVAVLLLTGVLASGCGTQNGTGTSGHPPPPVGSTFYIDCSAANNGNGTQASPGNALASVDGTSFKAGEQILFRRGTRCNGSLIPVGSGTSSSPIVIDADGTGTQPIIDGGTNLAAVQLVDEQGWGINNLEVVGGNYYGVNIAGKSANATYSHFRLRNLNVHGAHFIGTTAHDSGEIVITIGNAGEVVFLASVAHQYGDRRLRVAAVDATAVAHAAAPSRDELLNASYDLHLEFPLLMDEGGELAQRAGVGEVPTTFLAGADGRIIEEWRGPARPAELAWALRRCQAGRWRRRMARFAERPWGGSGRKARFYTASRRGAASATGSTLLTAEKATGG